MEIRNVIISSGLEYPKGELAKNFPQDKKIGRLSRLRLAGGETVAVEDSYFTEELYNTVRSLRTSQWRTRYLIATASMLTGSI
jgi:DNA-binding GntR family transcriptional regulator